MAFIISASFSGEYSSFFPMTHLIWFSRVRIKNTSNYTRSLLRQSATQLIPLSPTWRNMGFEGYKWDNKVWQAIFDLYYSVIDLSKNLAHSANAMTLIIRTQRTTAFMKNSDIRSIKEQRSIIIQHNNGIYCLIFRKQMFSTRVFRVPRPKRHNQRRTSVVQHYFVNVN